jgi:uncharacterized protein (TIGR02598 family)
MNTTNTLLSLKPVAAGPRRRRRSAFTLVEVTLALGVAALGLISILGLVPVGLKSNQAAIEQTVANGILSAVVADLRTTPPSSPPSNAISNAFQIQIPSNPVTAATETELYFTGEGKSSLSPTPDSRYLLTVTFLPNGSTASAVTLVNLQMSWPAAAVVADAAGSVKMFVALDRN